MSSLVRHLAGAAALCAIALASGASAADLPSRKAPVPIAPAPIMTWTGLYVGLNAGYGWNADPNTQTSASAAFVNPALAGAFINVPSASLAGANAVIPMSRGAFLAGGQIGFNYQFSTYGVVGVEADLQGLFASASNGSTTTAVPVAAPPGPAGRIYISSISASQKLDYLGTLRARVGFLATPSVLLYATVGMAFGHAGVSASVTQAITSPPGPAILPIFSSGSTSATRVGLALGAGGEWKFARNWSAKLEYLYYDLGSVANNLALVQVGPPGPGLQFINTFQARTRLNGHVVRAGLNYHFNCCAAAPVVAKY